MKQFDVGVFIGRFQPFHLGHVHNIRVGLASCEKMVLIIGSAFRSRSIKNPFTFAERKKMILADLASVDASWVERVSIEPVSDWLYNEPAWIDETQQAVLKHAKNDSIADSIAIVGHEKDGSSYYLKCFPEWSFVEVDNYKQYNATEFREVMFQNRALLADKYLVSKNESTTESSANFLAEFMSCDIYSTLLDEYRYIQEYKEAWSQAPYAPIFVTVDAVVICLDHILLVQRKHQPGKGLWALPGGFLEPEERVLDGIMRELDEETTLGCSSQVLRESLQKIQVFDYPDRSLRGRTITHAGYFKIEDDPLPEIQAADDAADTKWVKLETFWKMPEQMMDDHYQIVRTLIG
jgi:bifunctional NMN adenylyltransferase/nudix hydrolase